MLAQDVDGYRALDREILTLVRSGKVREGARMMVESYGGEIMGTCIGRVGDEALGEDAAQDALVRAVAALPEYQGDAGLRPWLHRIAANRCIDLLRSRKSRKSRVVDDYRLESVPGPKAKMPSEQLAELQERTRQVDRVRDALAAVKEPDRTWVELHYTHGVSYDDIAADVGMSRAAVKQRIWRAVKKVRALLGDPDGGS